MRPNDGRAITTFLRQALAEKQLTVFGDGSQTRSFCYVDDLIDGLVRMMNTPDDFTGPVNIGNPGEFSVAELAHKVIALTGSKSKLKKLPLPEDDPKQRQPDITLARSKLGWQPRTPLDEGLTRTIAYFKGLFSENKKPH
jgi:UDP-glucuronate decarboxylase